MDTGAPLPAIRRAGIALALAYVCRNPRFPGWESGAPPDHPGFEVFSAVLRFEGVAWLHFGPPNDEGLSEHPLYSHGLGFYGFREVLDSPEVPPGSSKRHWIATFHDETFEVVADSAKVVAARAEGEATQELATKYA